MKSLIELQRQIFEALKEHDKVNPLEVDRFVASMVDTLRSWRPISICSMSELAEPTDPSTAGTVKP